MKCSINAPSPSTRELYKQTHFEGEFIAMLRVGMRAWACMHIFLSSACLFCISSAHRRVGRNKEGTWKQNRIAQITLLQVMVYYRKGLSVTNPIQTILSIPPILSVTGSAWTSDGIKGLHVALICLNFSFQPRFSIQNCDLDAGHKLRVAMSMRPWSTTV